ncbi:hypothetical protein BOTBODRAFT_39450 [Botryobasidium botryosum FD-172 SS1]|uniref:Uncharacterized protein n=1 Tax=Botryobasidium botryosum (strain FD-172 SS1) TaxID=930990 RepID=A0A067M4Y0_BOTB1|nr:hypothetical protein BOTBODRAFT_39450 [Botryobasidium botryosum FD-172 SS1]
MGVIEGAFTLLSISAALPGSGGIGRSLPRPSEKRGSKPNYGSSRTLAYAPLKRMPSQQTTSRSVRMADARHYPSLVPVIY